MNVVVVVWSIQIGGAETFAIDLCNYLKSKGHKPYLFPVLAPWDKAYYKFIRSNNINVLSPYKGKLVDWLFWKINAFFFLFGKKGFRNKITALFFKRILKIYDIQLAISNSLIADNFVESEKTNDVIHIVVEHGEYSYAVIDNKVINTNGLLRADEVVCVSKWCEQTLKLKWNISSTVIYNGHNSKPITPDDRSDLHPDNSEFTFCMLGRGVAYKGWEEAIRAFLIVKKKHANCRLVLIGDGEFLQKMKTQYSKEEGILFTGRMTQPEKVIQKIQIGLIPSRRYEAFGITILDFFSFGKPVLASSIGAIPEIVNFNNKTGGLLLTMDENKHAQINELADKMMMLINNKELYDNMSEHAKEIYKSFSFTSTGDKYENLFHKYK